MALLDPDQIGANSEQRVFDALLKLVRQGWIARFEQTKPYSYDDRRGVDFWVFSHDARKVPLQVKSSHGGMVKHLIKQSPISCIVATGDVLKKVRQVLREKGMLFKKPKEGQAQC